LAEFRIEDLQAAAYNPRTISDEALAGLTKSIERFGCVEPIIVNVRGGRNRIVGGHQRAKALLATGIVKAMCVTVSCTDAEEKLLNVTLNNPHIQGEFTAALAEQIAALRASLGDDAALLDLRIAELAGGLARLGAGKIPDDQVPEPPKKAITKPGDLWILGDHRLLCGDATKAVNIDRLLCGERPVLMVTDPPYGVAYDPAWRNEVLGTTSLQTGKVANDDRPSWSAVFSRFPCDVAYVWHDGLVGTVVSRALSVAGYEIRSQIIWVKNRFPLSRGHYHWKHEACFYAVREGGHWVGNRKNHTVWADVVDTYSPDDELFVQKVDETTLCLFDGTMSTVWEVPLDVPCGGGHSTQKPVECMGRPMRHCSKEGDGVADPFLGSGTTLIAAEKLGRRCYGLEIEPTYCDVIVERWQQFTGGKAKREKGTS